MTLSTTSILSTGGNIARRLHDYETRPQQLHMAEAVERAIADESHLAVEAGTGVGKSFAYVVPAILSAASRRESEGVRKPLIVSTHTISLQEQLISRDIPFLNAVLPVEFSAVLVKGRGNYISVRRMKGAIDRSHSMFSRSEELEQLEHILRWSKLTTDGSRSDLKFRPLPQVWDEVFSDHGNCLGKKCPTYDECFYYKARRRIWNADLLVVNHALFFSDLALRREGANILPDYDVVILDEAHTVESVAGDHLGIAVSSGQLEYLFNRLYNDRMQRGLLVHHSLKEAQEIVTRLWHQQDDFFAALQTWQSQHCSSNGRVRRPPGISNPLSGSLKQLSAVISEFANSLKSEEETIELVSAAERCLNLAASIDSWLNQSMPNSVYWTEITGRQRQRTKLICCPIDVALLRDEIPEDATCSLFQSARYGM